MTQQVALVTGASRGIGRDIAESLINLGYLVAIGYNALKGPAELLAGTSDLAVAVPIDISSNDSIKQAFATTRERLGEVNILVNNAGIAQPRAFMEITDTDWENMLSVNLLGAVRCTRQALPSMLQNKYGRIINISSIGGQWGGIHQVHYAAAKAGLINFTKSMARLYSADGITCNAVAPGLIETSMSSKELEIEPVSARLPHIPIGRLGKASEVASIVSFLASADAGYITGQTINVNGGMYSG